MFIVFSCLFLFSLRLLLRAVQRYDTISGKNSQGKASETVYIFFNLTLSFFPENV